MINSVAGLWPFPCPYLLNPGLRTEIKNRSLRPAVRGQRSPRSGPPPQPPSAPTVLLSGTQCRGLIYGRSIIGIIKAVAHIRHRVACLRCLDSLPPEHGLLWATGAELNMGRNLRERKRGRRGACCPLSYNDRLGVGGMGLSYDTERHAGPGTNWLILTRHLPDGSFGFSLWAPLLVYNVL